MSGDVAMGGVDPPVGDQRPGKRLKVELEPLPLDKVCFYPHPPAISRPVEHLLVAGARRSFLLGMSQAGRQSACGRRRCAQGVYQGP